MVSKNRKSIINLINNIRFILNKHEHLKEDLLYLEGEEKHQQILEFYARIIAKLTKQLNKLPIGYRYTGTFYIRKAYTFPTAYEKIIGSAFMREDLCSWAIENEERFKFGYRREIFSAANDKMQIERENAEPVFSNITV